MNQKGWLRIVEAVFAVLLIGGVLLFLISKQQNSSNSSEEFYSIQLKILRNIETDSVLRESILTLELEGGEFLIPENINSFINDSLPFNYECISKICFLNQICDVSSSILPVDKEIFSNSVAISANREIYSPKQLKLFCWEKS